MRKFQLFTAIFLNVLMLYLITNHFSLGHAKVDFTNVDWFSTNKSMVYFDSCFLKSVNRTYKYFSMRLKWCKNEPHYNISFGIALLKKANGYKPFLYNITLDACKYLRTRSNPVMRYFHSWFEAHSNMNHNCPYGLDDIVVDKLPIYHINHLTTIVLPIPTGEYLFHSSWYTYNTKRAIVKVKFSIS